MQGQKTGRGIERTCGGSIDIAFAKHDTRRIRTERAPGLVEHGTGRIDADKAPARLRRGQDLQFKTAASPQHQHTRIFGRMFGQQNRRHPMQVGKSRNEPLRAVAVAPRMLGIVEGGEQRLHRIVIRHGSSPDRKPVCDRPAEYENRP
jgi:hypothetical protein